MYNHIKYQLNTILSGKYRFKKLIIIVINTLIPDNIACEFTNENISLSEVYPAERQIIQNASKKRIQQFLAGRNCAHLAIKKLNFNNQQPILIGNNREPVWPSGLTGSITHINGYSVAVIASTKEISGIGIDIELNSKLNNNIIPNIQTNSEIIRNGELSLSDRILCINKLIFSAKESVFKFIYPFVLKYIKFKDVEIILDVETKTFKIFFLNLELSSTFKNSVLIGKFEVNQKYIATAVYKYEMTQS